MKWILFFLPFAILAKEGVVSAPASEAPWFTGPIIASSATTIPAGHWNIEPYFYVNAIPARYNNDWKAKDEPTLWNLNWNPLIWAGVTNWMSIQFSPAWNWNHRDGAGHWTLSDWSTKFEFQLHLDQIPHKSWLPSIKLSFQEIFPTGKYQNADPKKHGTDLGGLGAFSTQVQLAFGKLIHVTGRQWIQTRLNLNYQFAPPVHVHGINAYGGGIGTRGTIRPGQIFAFDYSFEYAVTRNWVLAFDLAGEFQGTSHFTGKTAVQNTRPAWIQYSFAPAVEYNWSQNLGIITGVWFTIAGKNIAEFYTYVFALNYYK